MFMYMRKLWYALRQAGWGHHGIGYALVPGAWVEISLDTVWIDDAQLYMGLFPEAGPWICLVSLQKYPSHGIICGLFRLCVEIMDLLDHSTVQLSLWGYISGASRIYPAYI